jgi:hypothetical protein
VDIRRKWCECGVDVKGDRVDVKRGRVNVRTRRDGYKEEVGCM